MASNEQYDLLMKFIVIGNSGTGKSCILHRFIERKYVEDQTHTIGVEFGMKVVDMLGKKLKLQIWDTAGQERYRAVTRSYYRGAAGCLLVYDITNRESFDAVEQWLQDARHLAGPDLVVMLVGNKADLGSQDERQVTHIEASLFAQEHGIKHFETSAVTGEFVEEAFLVVAKNALERELAQHGGGEHISGDTDNAPLIHSDSAPSRRKGCAC